MTRPETKLSSRAEVVPAQASAKRNAQPLTRTRDRTVDKTRSEPEVAENKLLFIAPNYIASFFLVATEGIASAQDPCVKSDNKRSNNNHARSQVKSNSKLDPVGRVYREIVVPSFSLT